MYTFDQVKAALSDDPLSEGLVQLDILAQTLGRLDICEWAKSELEGYTLEAAAALTLWVNGNRNSDAFSHAAGKLPRHRRHAEVEIVYRSDDEISTQTGYCIVDIGVLDLEIETENIQYRHIGESFSIGLTYQQKYKLKNLIRIEARRKLAQLFKFSSELPTSPRHTIGQWNIIRNLPGGAQGEVMLVERHFPDSRRGVLKRIPKERLQSGKARARFLREIATLKRLDHPCIVKVLGASTALPEPWVVMEHAPYGSLDDHIKAIFKGDVWRTLRMARDVALALQAAHAKKIIHRDIKPKNILLHSLDHAVVADFGIAYDPDDAPLTSIDEKVGPKDFAPREYFDGRIEPSPAFDIYCLGGVIYCAMSGGNKLQRRAHDLPELNLCKIFNRPELQLINDLLAKLLAEKPEDRIQTMDEVIREIDQTCRKLLSP